MKKVIAVSIRNALDKDVSDQARIIEVKELDEYLNDGYRIIRSEVVVTPTSSVFTVIYQLEK